MKEKENQTPKKRTLWHAIKDFEDEVEALVPSARIKLLVAWKEGDRGPFSIGYCTARGADDRKRFLGLTVTRKRKAVTPKAGGA